MNDAHARRPKAIALGIIVSVLATMALVGGAPGASSANSPANTDGKVDAAVSVAFDKKDTATFWVLLGEKADVSRAASAVSRSAQGRFVVSELHRVARRSQAGLRSLLKSRNATFTPFWIANAIRVTGSEALMTELAGRPEVARVLAPKVYHIPKPTAGATDFSINAIEWGIANIQADRVWNEFGVRGESIVVGSVDTGVDFDHPALVAKYRGNLGGGSFDHNYNWFDPSSVCGSPSVTPCDNNNHGTHTIGTMVGDDGAGNQIGVAPAAKFISAKGCETNSCSDAALLASGQWILAPTDLAGNNPRPDLRPDIVNNSWGGGGGDPWYTNIVDAWNAAGIMPIFSNGNDGPGCNTAGSPGDYTNSYSAGAYDINNAIASFSSRGAGGFGDVKPNIAAPGVNIRSSINGGGYGNFNGTSMAAPHLAGTVALIWSAAPALRGDINATRALLDNTATDTPNSDCGGTDDDNNVFGEGRLNAYEAVLNSPRGENTPPTAGNDTYSTNEDTALTVAAPGVLGNDSDPDGDSLTAAPVSGPSHGSLTLNADGSFTYTPAANYNGPDSFLYSASDGTQSASATVSITVNAVGDAPVATNDSHSTNEDTALSVAAPGVLSNDSDPDGGALTAARVSGPSHGTLTLNANGSFSYTPAANYTGPDSFTYRASDGTATSNVATVSITVTSVNDAPVILVLPAGSCGANDRSGTLNLLVADVETSANALTMSATSSNTVLVPNGNVSFSGFAFLRFVTITAVSGRTGTAVITVRVSDGTSNSSIPVTLIAAGGGNNTVNGTAGTDVLLGQNGSDKLSGLGSNDNLCGGNGSDRLTGGGGADEFSGGPGNDTATDFNPFQGDTRSSIP